MSVVTVIVPTYWSWPTGEPGHPEDAVYDHPTPLDQEGTLGRLLRCLTAWEGEFNVLVITVAVNSELEEAAEAKVERIIAPFRASYPLVHFAAGDLPVIYQRMEELGIGEHTPFISLGGYSSVRNCQLLVPHILGSEVIIALDDDEVVEPDYLEKALEFIGREYGGELVAGVAGFYLDSAGRNKLPEGEVNDNIFRRKNAIMNKATRALEAKPGRLVETAVAFGGNMVFHRSLFTQVPFDPYIARGEDIDYLINSRFLGFRFYLDKALLITHLPPEEYGALPYRKLCQDIFRFIHEREKLAQAKKHPGLEYVTSQTLDPYPGRFLGPDLEEQAFEALEEMGPPGSSATRIIAQAQDKARRAAPQYFRFQKAWSKMIAVLDQDDALRGSLRGTKPLV